MTWLEELNRPMATDHPSPPKPRKRAKSPRWDLLNTFVDFGQRLLTCSAVRVWLVLYRETGRDGLAKLTVGQISEKAGIGTTAVKNGLGELKAKKFVVLVSRGSRNKGPSVRRLLPIPTATLVDEGRPFNGHPSGHCLGHPSGHTTEGTRARDASGLRPGDPREQTASGCNPSLATPGRPA